MPVYNVGNEIIHTEGGRTVWSTEKRPAKLLPENKFESPAFAISFPDFTKSNCYGYDIGTQSGFTMTSCMSVVSINPQEWDSGLSYVCPLPALCNYFEVEVNLARIVNPSTYLGVAFPKTIRENYTQLLDGGSAICERIGHIVRMFSFERSGNAIYLRRKQSVADRGPQVPWNPGNATTYPGSGGQREGWTYGGDPNAWPAYFIESKSGGNINKNRGQVNACSLVDPSNYASTWQGRVTITPGFIEP